MSQYKFTDLEQLEYNLLSLQKKIADEKLRILKSEAECCSNMAKLAIINQLELMAQVERDLTQDRMLDMHEVKLIRERGY